MKIDRTYLSDFWKELQTDGKFKREHKEGGYNIEYGLNESFEFYVKDVTSGEDVTKDFFQVNIVGDFQKVYNLLRCLRPGGEPKKPGPQNDIPAGVERCGFSCANPADPLSLLVRPSIPVRLADEKSLNFRWTAFPNFAPFEPRGHFLLLPSADFPPLPHFPQLFTRELLADFLSLCSASEDLLIFFNSRHAGATQDHFHLQAVCHPFGSEVPLQKAKTLPPNSNCVSTVLVTGSDYPINALVFDLSLGNDIIEAAMAFQFKLIPFNLIFIQGRVFLVPRDSQNEIVREFSNVLASMEVCGKFILSDKTTFDRTTDSLISAALARIQLSVDEMLLASGLLLR